AHELSDRARGGRGRHGLPRPRSRGPGRLLAAPAGRRRRHHGRSRGAVGPGRCSRRPRRGGAAAWWLPGPGRRFRPRVLRHLAPGSRGDGPAAAAGPRTELDGTGARRCGSGRPARRLGRRLPRRHRRRLRHARPPQRPGHRVPPLAGRTEPRSDRQPGLVPSRSARAQPHRGRGAVLVPGRRPPGVRKPALGNHRVGAGRWRPPESGPGQHTRLRPGGSTVPGRPLPHLRRARQRHRPGRGRRRGRPEAPDGRPRRRRPGALRPAGRRREQRRRWPGPHRARRSGAATAVTGRLRPGGGGTGARAVRGTARHRHQGGRPGRGGSPRNGVRRGPGRRTAPARGLGEDQHRAPGRRRGRHRADQGGAVARARDPPGEPALHPTAPVDPHGAAEAPGERRHQDVARRPAAGRCQLVRPGRHQLPLGGRRKPQRSHRPHRRRR
ncbi:LOW QUALITY PROTEIN: polyketide synthase type I, partial [Streptomyces himastatinicus ATCC 53653]